MHGGNLREARELFEVDEFIDLSANINPFGPPDGVWSSLIEGMNEIVNYPDPESKALIAKLSNRLSVPIENIMVGNGAGELIFTILQALKPKKVLIPTPAFSEYERAAISAGAEVRYISLGSEGWGTYNLEGKQFGCTRKKEDVEQLWHEQLEGCSLVFLCSPHNPTGSVLDQETFELILRLTKELGCYVLFDESFIDFLPDKTRRSARSYLDENEHLIVLYSLTKFFSIPGLRLGAAFADQTLLGRFDQYRDPWSVNVLAQRAGIASLNDLKYPVEVRQKLFESRDCFYREFELAEFKDFRLCPTSVNFSLIEVIDDSVQELIQYLGTQGVLVRDCSSFMGLSGNYIRVAIKDKSAMKRLIEGLKMYCTENP